MAISSGKRSGIILFSDPLCALCHRTRIAAAEKNITVDIINTDPNNLPDDLVQFNPYNSVPTLIDRDLVLYEVNIIMEYFDERFPHPPLMPVDPISRARIRLTLYRIDREWYRLLNNSTARSGILSPKARKLLAEDLIVLNPVFKKTPFFMNEEFSLLDCALAPLLWRLPLLEIKLPVQAKAVEDYAQRLFARNAFQQSLSPAEREMRTHATGRIA